MSTTRGRLVIVTGGPGAGKTTLVNQLHRAGFGVREEAGRAIVRDQMLVGGPALPWSDPDLFDELVLAQGMRSYTTARDQGGTVFFDHGIPCIAGYKRARGTAVPVHLDAAAAQFRYDPLVLVAPPWQEIYRRDSERWETFDHAERIHEAIVEVHKGYGYDLVELPRTDVGDRLRFTLDRLGADPPV
ncbi:AAA family ATPase [Micromonospora sp. LH3U1]|uniref:AAA family ATPase n=1 Tax=Micromonospora sp. LH3U1 TaxID=3018339 RepID=UPI00234B40BE|nr:AAA family ATPase [Micromonospora sp. LH3U1]WCN79439.1 AAA family ATPase [Micromonospora sp. LH3U1]